MIDEKLMPLPQAVETATGRRPHLSTCLRWAKRGCRGIKLECQVLGSRYLTSPDAVLRFLDATTSEKLETDERPPVVSPRQQAKSAASSAAKLAKRLTVRIK